MILDKLGIAVRTGQHCAEPVMDHYATTGMCRASFALYNTLAEADALAGGVERAVRMLRAAAVYTTRQASFRSASSPPTTSSRVKFSITGWNAQRRSSSVGIVCMAVSSIVSRTGPEVPAGVSSASAISRYAGQTASPSSCIVWPAASSVTSLRIRFSTKLCCRRRFCCCIRLCIACLSRATCLTPAAR